MRCIDLYVRSFSELQKFKSKKELYEDKLNGTMYLG